MIQPNKLNLPEEVVKKLMKRIIPPKDQNDANPCWEWMGRTDNHDRPWFRLNGVYVKAKILVYECYYGPIGENTTLVPTCLTQKCVNPSHLVLKKFWSKRKKIIDLPIEVRECEILLVIGEILQSL